MDVSNQIPMTKFPLFIFLQVTEFQYLWIVQYNHSPVCQNLSWLFLMSVIFRAFVIGIYLGQPVCVYAQADAQAD